ncbi:MAG: pyruvate dehydrogenase (acetyl-transferring) E1 component subunit alpha [Chitinophagales bacterium]|nr:pyruvate dehydrogenase (acetyl-transferring) E1 component subunit alpha [Chitinophagales bacterium]
MAHAKITKETYVFWYELMLRMRKFEERAGMLYGQQKYRGFSHLYIGQEAVAAGMISAINQEDPIITAYRDHALALAKGISARECMAELYGKVTGCSKGKGGSMHFFSKEKYFFGGHGIVGAQIALGAGMAFAEKYKETQNVVLTMFGDGAVWQGVLHETFNMSKLWNLPVIFICENNGYAMGTSVKRSAASKEIYMLGEAFDIPSMPVDGMNPEAVHNAVKDAAELCRSGNGPVFLEIRTYRYKGHSMSDPQKYRTKEEVESYKEKDPIHTVLEKIKENNWLSEEQIEEINKKVKEEIDDCVTFAENSPYPDDSAIYEDIYTQTDYPFLKD